MQRDDEFEYRYKLIFPLAKTYAVDDVLNFISEVVYACNHANPIEKIPPHTFRGRWDSDINEYRQIVGDAPATELIANQVVGTEPGNIESRYKDIVQFPNIPSNEHNKERFLADHKTYLIDRLLKAVVDGKIQLWDWTGGKVVDPPIGSTVPFSPHSHHRPVYQTALWWAKMSSILKPDLIKFCGAEGIRAIFEEEQSTNQANSNPGNCANDDTSITQPTAVQHAQESANSSANSLIPLEQSASITVVSTISQAHERPPGKLPPTAINKLAIQAAWEIEQETNEKATVHQVMSKLQAWVEIEGNCLDSKTDTGVMWIRVGEDTPKKYTMAACEKALQRWNRSRA